MSLTIMQTSNKNEPAIKIEFKAQQLPEAVWKCNEFFQSQLYWFPNAIKAINKFPIGCEKTLIEIAPSAWN